MASREHDEESRVFQVCQFACGAKNAMVVGRRRKTKCSLSNDNPALSGIGEEEEGLNSDGRVGDDKKIIGCRLRMDAARCMMICSLLWRKRMVRFPMIHDKLYFFQAGRLSIKYPIKWIWRTMMAAFSGNKPQLPHVLTRFSSSGRRRKRSIFRLSCCHHQTRVKDYTLIVAETRHCWQKKDKDKQQRRKVALAIFSPSSRRFTADG